jgi:hypothetical protein
MFDIDFTCVDTPSATSVSIEMEKPSDLVAPAQIWLRATDFVGLADFEETGTIYDGAHHEYYYEWTIRGEPLSAFSKVENLLSAHNNPNKAYGREVAFGLPVAGDYVIDLVVTDRLGNTATASTGTQTVVSPESFFPEADRIYVASDGDFTGLPAASEKVETLEELRLAMASRTANKTWVAVKRGLEYTLDGVNALATNDNSKGTLVFEDNTEIRLISTYGASSVKPWITPDPRADRNYTIPMFNLKKPRTGDWRTVSGFEFRGNYDPEIERGHACYITGVTTTDWEISGGGGFSLFHDLEVSGLDRSLQPGGDKNGNPHHHLTIDCEVNGWRDFAHFGGQAGQRLGIVGCKFVQKPNVPNKGAKDDVRNTHGPIRISDSAYVFISQLDLFSRNHWDGNDQPCTRLFSECTTGQTGHVERCTMEGGAGILQCARREGGAARATNIRIMNNLFISSAYTNTFIEISRSGITIHDNVMVRNDAAKIIATANTGAIGAYTPDDPWAGEGLFDEPLIIYNNTLVNLLGDTVDDNSENWLFETHSSDYDNKFKEFNNVNHKPSGNTIHDDFAPIDISTAISGVTLRYLGYRRNFEYPTKVLEEDVANGGTLRWPYSEIGDGIYDGGPASTGPTNQAYWQALEGIDDLHQLNLDTASPKGPRRYHAEVGHIDVDFSDPDDVIITNNTGETWDTGRTARLWLDRSSLMPAMDSTYANPETVPLPRPQAGSPAIGAATSGRISPRDFLLTERGASPSKGALEAA